jgi:hypothetical protein
MVEVERRGQPAVPHMRFEHAGLSVDPDQVPNSAEQSVANSTQVLQRLQSN